MNFRNDEKKRYQKFLEPVFVNFGQQSLGFAEHEISVYFPKLKFFKILKKKIRIFLKNLKIQRRFHEDKFTLEKVGCFGVKFVNDT
jgi:hypothetical protein